MGFGWMLRVTSAVLRRPSLWATAVTQLWRLRRRRWWGQVPFLPVPSREYLRFRVVTAYGDPDRAPEPTDVVTYLHWCRAWPRVSR